MNQKAELFKAKCAKRISLFLWCTEKKNSLQIITGLQKVLNDLKQEVLVTTKKGEKEIE